MQEPEKAQKSKKPIALNKSNIKNYTKAELKQIKKNLSKQDKLAINKQIKKIEKILKSKTPTFHHNDKVK